MIRHRVTVEVAELAYDAGCMVGGSHLYNRDEDAIIPNFISSGSILDYKGMFVFMQPQHLLHEWIRQMGLHVEVYCNAVGWGWIVTKLNGTELYRIEDDDFLTTYEDALELGMKRALLVLIQYKGDDRKITDIPASEILEYAKR